MWNPIPCGVFIFPRNDFTPFFTTYRYVRVKSEKEVIPMPLVCSESGRALEAKFPLYGGTRQDTSYFGPLSYPIVGLIPKSLRRKIPCTEGEKGVDVHEGFASREGGMYSEKDFSIGAFLFSLSEEAAKQYLPHHVKKYPSS